MRQNGYRRAGRLFGVIASGSMMLAVNAAADDSKMLQFEVSAGLEYSSRVAVDEVDSVAPDGDLAALLGAGVDFSHSLTDSTAVDLGYKFSTTVHDRLSQFDLQSHFVSIDLSQDLGKIDVGIAQRLSQSSLDGADFLAYRQAAPYLTAFFGERFFVRAELGIAQKDFDTVTERDSDIHSIGADLFVFLRGVNTYMTLGYRFDSEDAVASQFDHNRHNLKVHLIQRIEVFNRSAKLNLGVRYESRSYSDVWPSTGLNRDDQRQKLRTSLDVPLTERLGAELRYELRDVDSNVPEADRSDQLASIELVARF